MKFNGVMTQSEDIILNLATISDFFVDQKGVICAFLFGSAQDGVVRQGSDVDLAVLFDRKLSF